MRAPSRSSALGVVGDELADVGDHRRGHSAPIASSSSRPISSSSPCVKTTRPSTTTWVTSAAVAAYAAVCSSAPVPAVRGLAVSRVTRSAGAPTSIRVEPACRRADQLGGGPVAALPVASRSSISSPRISSNRSMTAWLSLPRVSRPPASCSRRAGPMPSPRSRSVVGQMQTLVPVVPSSSTSSLGQVRRVHDRGVRSEQVGLVQQPGRGDAVRREAVVVLGDLLGEVDVQRRSAVEDRQLLARHRAHRVDRRRAVARRARPPRPRRRRRSSAPARPRPASRTRCSGSRCPAARSGSRPRARPRAARGPSRSGRRTASRPAGGAGSGTPSPW